jgi:DNA-binding response OmpR family regulator
MTLPFDRQITEEAALDDMGRPLILVVDDEMSIRQLLIDCLSDDFEAIEASDGNGAVLMVDQVSPDVVILDIMMPGLSGFQVLQQIRKTLDTPVIMLSALTDPADKVKSFDLGADDYITKPFSTEELKLRVNAILRRVKRATDSKMMRHVIGNYTFDFSNHLLSSAASEHQLTKRESELLHLLCLNMNNVLRREVALKTIWGEDDYFMGRSMDVYITKLRKLLRGDPAVSIVNVHNTGFRLEVKDKTS